MQYRATVLALATTLLACGGDDHDTTDSSDTPTDAPAIDAPVDDAATDASGLADPCPETPPACPTLPAAYARGDGLAPIDHCAFPLVDDNQWDDRTTIISALAADLTPVTLSNVLADLNRTATRATSVPGNPPGLRTAFTWQSGDTDVAYWIPQGITGSFDASAAGLVDGRRVLLVSWYYEQDNDPGSTVDKGVRIAIVDATNPAAVTYRFALLVEPVTTAGHADFTAVHVHAGGLAWIGDLLYVPVTGSGFRVFDLSKILRIDGTVDAIGYDATTAQYNAHGYRYVIPQVGTYTDAGTCEAVFSWVALDRTTNELVSGEYDATAISGRVYRWPLDPATNRLALTDRARVIPSAAFYLGETHVQGGLALGTDRYWLASSRPAAGAGELKKTAPSTRSTTYGWADSPEDMAFSPQTSSVWSLSETAGARYVFDVATANIGGP